MIDQFKRKIVNPDYRSAIIYSTSSDKGKFKTDLVVIRDSVNYILSRIDKP